jgi:RimJ/RimL family protein N-acetyltransferase
MHDPGCNHRLKCFYEFLIKRVEDARLRVNQNAARAMGDVSTLSTDAPARAHGASARAAAFKLRPPHLGDVVPYTAFLADPAVRLWLDDSAQRPLSTGRVESLLLRDGWCLWSIESEGAFIGVTSLYEPDPAGGSARFSIVIGDKSKWGRGLGTAVTASVLAYAFTELGLRKVESDYLATHVASARIHERCGFVVEGRARDDAWRQGRWVDRIWLSMLRSEWERANPRPAIT